MRVENYPYHLTDTLVKVLIPDLVVRGSTVSMLPPLDQGSGAGSIFQPYPALILLAFSGASPVTT